MHFMMNWTLIEHQIIFLPNSCKSKRGDYIAIMNTGKYHPLKHWQYDESKLYIPDMKNKNRIMFMYFHQ